MLEFWWTYALTHGYDTIFEAQRAFFEEVFQILLTAAINGIKL